MSWLRSLGRSGRFLVAVAVGGALFGVATAVQASIPDASGVIHACYKTSSGSLRVTDTGAGGRCQSSETPLTWSQQGPPGASGMDGKNGATGPTGATGPVGPSDAFTDYEGGHFLNNGDEKTIVSVTLPIGHYTLSGDVEFEDDLGSTAPGVEVSCHWNSLATVHGFGADGLGVLDDMPVHGDVNVTSNDTPVGLLCNDKGPDSIGIGGSLIATRVGTITPAS